MRQLTNPSSPSELIKACYKAIREEIATNPEKYGSVNGTVRVSMTPLCIAADNWLGGINQWIDTNHTEEIWHEPCDYVFELSICPGCARIQSVNEGENRSRFDTAAYAAMQAAYSRLKQLQLSFGRKVSALQQESDICELHGYAKRDGDFTVHIFTTSIANITMNFLDICVSIVANGVVEDSALAQIGARAMADIFETHGCTWRI